MAEQVQYHLNIPTFIANFELGTLEAEELVADITANLRHFCEQRGLDYGSLDKRGYDHYIEESEENRRAASS